MTKTLNLNASSSLSKLAKRSKVDTSSIIPTKPTLEIESYNEMIAAVVENKSDGEEEENVYNSIFMGFEELQRNFCVHLIRMKWTRGNDLVFSLSTNSSMCTFCLLSHICFFMYNNSTMCTFCLLSQFVFLCISG